MYFINKIWDLMNNNHMQIFYGIFIERKKCRLLMVFRKILFLWWFIDTSNSVPVGGRSHFRVTYPEAHNF